MGSLVVHDEESLTRAEVGGGSGMQWDKMPLGLGRMAFIRSEQRDCFVDCPSLKFVGTRMPHFLPSSLDLFDNTSLLHRLWREVHNANNKQQQHPARRIDTIQALTVTEGHRFIVSPQS